MCRSALIKRVFISKAGTCAKYTKEANSFKTVTHLFTYPIVYSLSRKFGCKKKRYSMSLRGCSSLKVKISVIGLGEFNKLFFSFFPGTPGLLNKSIMYSKTVIRYV